MNYFKMIRDNKVIDVGTTFVRLDLNHDILFVCDANHAQFVESYDCNRIYHDTWLKTIRNINIDYEIAEIVEIDQHEYEDLIALLEDNEIVRVNEEKKNEEPEIVDNVKDEEQEEKPMSISEMRDKIKELTKLVDKLTSMITMLSKNSVD